METTATGSPAQEPLIKRLLIQKVNELRPGIDWSQIEFVRTASGRILRMTSRDPDINAFLKTIIVG